ncbi:hypothetical protein HK15_13065 [Acetobacter orientalis]|uniref:Uncharacterized protein n=1 Tax=Acetobacter orientalis TaxID=146474 RepID=A0A252B344_9PROT|nr:hypothetical protein [Acetobacter orientalis]OUI98776.1 hypothetical protein HK15_13065 [Acetobacter orientalis]
MSGTLYTRPTLRDKAGNALVLAAAIAGRVWFAVIDSPYIQAAFGLLVYGSIAYLLMFTETGLAVTGDLLAMLMAFGSLFADLGSAFL